jgi:hypothetical protein
LTATCLDYPYVETSFLFPGKQTKNIASQTNTILNSIDFFTLLAERAFFYLEDPLGEVITLLSISLVEAINSLAFRVLELSMDSYSFAFPFINLLTIGKTTMYGTYDTTYSTTFGRGPRLKSAPKRLTKRRKKQLAKQEQQAAVKRQEAWRKEVAQVYAPVVEDTYNKLNTGLSNYVETHRGHIPQPEENQTRLESTIRTQEKILTPGNTLLRSIAQNMNLSDKAEAGWHKTLQTTATNTLDKSTRKLSALFATSARAILGDTQLSKSKRIEQVQTILNNPKATQSLQDLRKTIPFLPSES